MSTTGKPFTGFSDPTQNWSRLPHQLMGALPLINSLSEMKVILYVLRHTWGFQQDERRISTNEFQYGRKHSFRYKQKHPNKSDRLDSGTGMSKSSILRGIEHAVEHGFLQVEIDDSDLGRIKKYYSLTSGDSQTEVSKQDPSSTRSQNDTPTVSQQPPTRPKTRHHTKKETIETNLERNPPPAATSSPLPEDAQIELASFEDAPTGKELDEAEPLSDDVPFYLEGETPTKPTQRHSAEQRLAATHRAIVKNAKNGTGRAGVADPTKEDNPWVDITVRSWCKIAGKNFDTMSKGTKLKLAKVFKDDIGFVADSGAVPVAAKIEAFPFADPWYAENVGFEWPGAAFCNKLVGMLQPESDEDPEWKKLLDRKKPGCSSTHSDEPLPVAAPAEWLTG